MRYKLYRSYTYLNSTDVNRGTDLINCYDTLAEAIKHCPYNDAGPNYGHFYYICSVENGIEKEVWSQNEYKDEKEIL